MGPYGGSVLSLAIDPSNTRNIYAGTDWGVFKSMDGGTSWTALNGFTPGRVLALALDLSAPSVLYVGIEQHAVFKTTDGGATWFAVGTGLNPESSVYSLAIATSSPSTLYLGSPEGVFKSSDAGSSWSRVGADVPGFFGDALAVDPTSASTVYATGNLGVYKTTDGGTSWKAVGLGPVVRSLAIARTSPLTIYAGTDSLGVFRSVDGGASWIAVNEGLGANGIFVGAVAVDSLSPATVYVGTVDALAIAGLYKSTDGGAHWTAARTGLSRGAVGALAIDPVMPSNVYAGVGGSGVFRSVNGGNSWTASSSGLADIEFLCSATAPGSPGTVYFGASSGLFKTTDGGSGWVALDTGDTGSTSLPIISLAVDPVSTSTLYAGWGGGGVIKSVDGGKSFVRINNGLDPSGVTASALAVDPHSPATVYVGTFWKVFKSTDGGASWSDTHLPTLSYQNVTALAIDPVTPSTLYAGTRFNNIFKTTDGGASWAPVNTGLGSGQPRALAIDPDSPGTVYAGTSDGVFKTANGGGSWVPASVGLVSLDVFALVIDPLARTIYAGTSSGVFRSANGGAIWTASNDGLSQLRVQTLAFDAASSTLYAGTFRGAFKITFGEAGPCVPGVETLCLNGNRFKLDVSWRAVHLGTSGAGQAMPLTSDTGYFWFFQSTNVELVIKVLDARAINGKFWVFYGALSNVEYTITVVDTVTGEIKNYFNPQNTLASVADTSAFPLSGGASVTEASLATESVSLRPKAESPPDLVMSRPERSEACVAGPTALCLSGGRFRVEVAWRSAAQGTSGAGQAASLTSDTGTFWFFQSTNVELILKVLDARAINGHFWVFYGALSNVEYTITVTDTLTGAVKTYFNPQGQLASVADTSAF